jgi:hypothetical protein
VTAMAATPSSITCISRLLRSFLSANSDRLCISDLLWAQPNFGDELNQSSLGRSGANLALRRPVASFMGRLPSRPLCRRALETVAKQSNTVTPMLNGRCRLHGGPSPGAPKGNRNAFRHGRYSAKAIADRRGVAALLRSMRALAAATEEVDGRRNEAYAATKLRCRTTLTNKNTRGLS